MQTVFTGKEKVGDIVVNFPKASNLFKEYRIDFCCGGNRTLSEVLKQKGLDDGEVLNRLNRMYQDMVNLKESNLDFPSMGSLDLIEHIVNTHHVYLQKELPLLSEYVTKILRVHGASHGELAQLHRLFHTLKMELESHLIKEEEIIFPLIAEFEQTRSEEARNKAIKVIDELEKEHTGVGDILREMREITNQYTLPEGACRTYTLTFQKLEELESDLFQHIHLENNILFRRLAS
ncbi:iron-sulfur cluster repair di-iron protein [Effusibacillus lacus]|uniref:Iron-sulfur cluster repair di-iron protein n=1 Tax=Effusibacillus lacus TaxID=1348429 RepID=A0A292YLC8_9BACL|nr:iron-sulfur cluster repair di-iron protein [Effusibacillus lacus]TCS69417.1 regulator of cell morphogenesis and NO signaling [Effusibacillus lacus]GAX89184.1 iron-sulfur cluster repair di-iron protein [Effusibacillus lacus]